MHTAPVISQVRPVVYQTAQYPSAGIAASPSENPILPTTSARPLAKAKNESPAPDVYKRQGFAAAIAISSKILAGEPGIVEKYKKFLSSGGSMDPIDLLKICGVDMSSPQPVKDALDVFGEYLSKMEAEVSKEEA